MKNYEKYAEEIKGYKDYNFVGRIKRAEEE